MTRFERAASGAPSITGGSGATMGQNESIYDSSDERTYGFNYRELEKKGYSREETAEDPWAASSLIVPGDRERKRREHEPVERKKKRRGVRNYKKRSGKRIEKSNKREKAASFYWRSSKEIPYKNSKAFKIFI